MSKIKYKLLGLVLLSVLKQTYGTETQQEAQSLTQVFTLSGLNGDSVTLEIQSNKRPRIDMQLVRTLKGKLGVDSSKVIPTLVRDTKTGALSYLVSESPFSEEINWDRVTKTAWGKGMYRVHVRNAHNPKLALRLDIPFRSDETAADFRDRLENSKTILDLINMCDEPAGIVVEVLHDEERFPGYGPKPSGHHFGGYYHYSFFLKLYERIWIATDIEKFASRPQFREFIDSCEKDLFEALGFKNYKLQSVATQE